MSRAIALTAIALVAWGALSFGAVYPWAYWPLIVGCGIVGGTAIVGRRAWQDPRLVAIGIAWAAVAVTIGLQMIPLPTWVVARLSPGVDAYFRAFQIGYQPSSLHALSLRPEATAVVLAEWIGLGALALGLARVLRPSLLEWCAVQLVGLGVGVATLGIVQRALMNLDEPAIYGFWRPQPGAMPFGPFVNRNHFAGWMVMALPVVVAYAWSLATRAERMGEWHAGVWRWLGSVGGNRVLLVAASALVMVVSVILTGSRSGLISLVAGLAVLAVFATRQAERARRWTAAALIAGLVGGAVFWAGADVLTARLSRASSEFEGRRAAWADTRHVVRDFPLFGTGLGTYKDAMLLYQTGPRTALYADAHNDYLQLLAEGGVITSVAVIGLIVTIARTVRRRLASEEEATVAWLRRGALAGLVAILAQSAVEFSLQMPGNAVLCAVLCSIAIHRSPGTGHARRV